MKMVFKGIKDYNVDYLSHIYEGTPLQYYFFSKWPEHVQVNEIPRIHSIRE